MKVSEAWLREWVDLSLSRDELVHRLNMAGLEVGSVEPVAGEFNGVIVGQVLEKYQHPNADRLSVCNVTVGEDQLLQIVCGAKNMAVGMKVPVAMVGAVLSGNIKIKRSKLRGVESQGMICSESELGLAEQSDGIMPLPDDAPVGQNVIDHLQLDDVTIDIDLTANRGDCLSVIGLARELSALCQAKRKLLPDVEIAAQIQTTQAATVADPAGCPRYITRVIEQVNAQAKTPLWMVEKLRRSGVRSVSLLVDITNYVMLLLGQPLHAFNGAKIRGDINVRWAKTNEKLTLFDGQEVNLQTNTLLITDTSGPLAMAGIMGGKATAVSDETTCIVLESAFFHPDAIQGRARQYGLHTDSSHRFERGVDSQITWLAIELATQLVIELAGGVAGPVKEITDNDTLPKVNILQLTSKKLQQTYGRDYDLDTVEAALTAIGCAVKATGDDQWQVKTPLHRYDLNLAIDLAEEVGRIDGFDKVPAVMPNLPLQPVSHSSNVMKRIRQFLVARGYAQTITFSFISEDQAKLFASGDLMAVSNPISEDLAVMRPSLIPGLMLAAKYNINRQQSSGRFFELGRCYHQQEQHTLTLLVYGQYDRDHWSGQRMRDFYDLKGELQALLQQLSCHEVTFSAQTLPAYWHPGQAASVKQGDSVLGYCGRLHPQVEKAIGVKLPCFAVEINLDTLEQQDTTQYQPLSKFPAIRRDLAFEVARELPAEQLLATIRSAAGHLLIDTGVFDVYTGDQIDARKKSIAVYLILQDLSHTLKDEEVALVVDRVVNQLCERCGAELRE